MTKGKASLWFVGLGVALTATGAAAQTGNEAVPIGPPQLQNFQLQPSREDARQPEAQGPDLPPDVAPREATPAPSNRSGPPIVAVPPPPRMPQLRLPPGVAGGARQPPATTPRQGAQGPSRGAPAARPATSEARAPARSQAAPPLPVTPAQSTPPLVPDASAPPGADASAPPVADASAPPGGEPISIPGEPMTPSTGGMLPLWLAGAGGLLLLLLLLLLGIGPWRRLRARQRVRGDALAAAREAAEAAMPAPPPPAPAPSSPPAAPAGDIARRPWLEIDLRAERATFNQTETLVQFELDIANVGAGQARDVRIDVKLFNAGAEQDREIDAFFRTAGRESARVRLPAVEAGVKGTIRGEVSMPREEMRALRLDERLLYIPVIAVNLLYDRGEGQTGQTSKSYVVGRELQQPSEKMGAFRVDQGPRVWRTIGQRQHKLARRI